MNRRRRKRCGNRERRLRFEFLEARNLLAAEIEPNNSLATANLFSANNTFTGRIDNLNDVDYFSFPLLSGETIQIRHEENDTTGTPAYVPPMALVNSAGETKVHSNDSHSFSFTVAVSGLYALRVDALSVFGIATGEYSIVATVSAFGGTTETEANNTQATADALSAVPRDFRGSLSTAADADFFSFSVTAGQAVTVKFADKPSNSPAVRLFSPAGIVVATQRNGEGLFAQIDQAGTYAIAVQTDNSGGTFVGDYAGQLLVVSNPTLDPETGNAFENATLLDMGPHVVPSLFLSPDASFSSRGLTGSYVNQSLRSVSAQNDWRATQTIAGTRLDPVIHFSQDGWGNRGPLNLTSGTNDNWDNFSVQWDGYIRIATPETQIYTASDDGSRMWIDLNGDGVFGSSGSEFINNRWGNSQSNTLGPASVALAVGDYRIRIQYETGTSSNSAYLMWSDRVNSGGAVSKNYRREGVGSLSNLTDVDVYAVNLTATAFYDFRLETTASNLARQNRVLKLYNEFGQPLDYSLSGQMQSSQTFRTRQETTNTYYVTVEATHETGLGAYALVAEISREFPKYRDVPLFYQDYTGYSKPEQVPEFLAFFESFYDIYQIDVTQTPPSSTEFVSWTFPDDETSGCGGSAGGGFGVRRPSGSGSGRCIGANWSRLADVWFGLSYHENGHGVGLPHGRQPLDTMSYGNQYEYGAVGSYNRIGGIYGNGDERTSFPKLQNNRNYLDWALEAGQIVLEQERNDGMALAQSLNPYFDEMTGDTDVRNDQVVVVGTIAIPFDTDFFRFRAPATEVYAIDIESAEFQYPLDAFVEILDAGGNVVVRNERGIDLDTGLASVDPYVLQSLTGGSEYYVRLGSELGTAGNYRLKLTPQRAFDQTGPKVAAAWPDGSASIDGTRQLVFWFNDQISNASLLPQNIIVAGNASGVRPGVASFDPITSTLTWRANSVLPPDNYTVTLRSGSGGITDLRGNVLDGETDGSLSFPEVSGNGAAGGNFTTTFTITQTDTTPATILSANASRQAHDRTMIDVRFTDELDVLDVYAQPFTLRGAGPDLGFGTADDTLSPVDVIYDRIDSTSIRSLRVYSRGVLPPDSYRVEASLRDAAGHSVSLSRVFEVGVAVPASALFTSAAKTTGGLTGTYVNQSLRSYGVQDDWRVSQTVAGTRNDPMVGFFGSSFGVRSQVGLTGGTDASWDNFSVQWDGVIVIPENGVRLSTRSDDGSRMWIDINNDGVFNSTGAEFVNNSWGVSGLRMGVASTPLNAGTYRIRLQHEEGTGGNQMQLQWDYGEALSTIDGFYTSPKVVDTSIQPHTVLTTTTSAVDVTFSEPILTSTLTTNSFRVRYSPNSTFFDSDDSFLLDADGVITWSPTVRRARLETATPLRNGHYLIELDGDAGGITGTSGQRLDGEYRDANIAGGALEYKWNDAPSGDGISGGDYRAMFVVAQSQLSLDIPATAISEKGGAVTATVRRPNAEIGAAATIAITSSDVTELVAPQEVIIPAGEAFATFLITAVDDSQVDGDQVVTVTVSSQGLLSGSDAVTVTDYEEPIVSPATFSLLENRVNGALVGAVPVSYAGSLLTWSILSGNTSGAFSINSSGQIRVANAAAVNFELNPTFTLTVEAVDSSSPPQRSSAAVNVNLANVNEAPTAIGLSATTVAENAAGAIIGNVSVGDPDSVDSHTLTLSDARFEVAAGKLKLKEGQSLDFEAGTSVPLILLARDAGGLSFTRTVSIQVSNVNEPPQAIGLSSDTVAENALGVVIGRIVVDDPDAGDAHTITLDDERFEIANGELKLRAGQGFDFESSPATEVVITATDRDGLAGSHAVTVRITNVNEAPEAILLSNQSVDENAAGAVVGTVSVVDPDLGNSHTISLDDVRFEVVAGQLKLKGGVALDFESGSHVPVVISALDQGGLSKAETIAVAVANVNEAPAASNQVVTTFEGFNVEIVLPASDPEGDPVSFAVVGPPHGTLSGSAPNFTYHPAEDFAGSVTFTYGASDGVLSSSVVTVSITVREVNDAPIGQADELGTVAEGYGTLVIPISELLSNDVEGPANEADQTLTITRVFDALGGSAQIVGANVVFTAVGSNYFGASSFKYEIADNGTTGGIADPQWATAVAAFGVSAVNDAPSAESDDLDAELEDGGQWTIDASLLLGNDSSGPANEAGQTLTIVGLEQEIGGSAVIQGSNVLFVPAADFVGRASFVYVLSDDGTSNGTNDFKTSRGTASFDVLPVNDRPGFAKGPDKQINDTNSFLIFGGWAKNLSKGPAGAADESQQFLSFRVENDNPNLFADQPFVTPLGALSVMPRPNVRGTAVVTVWLLDSGGTENGGINQSAPQTFEIEVRKSHPKHNVSMKQDVNGDRSRAAEDALSIVNFINTFGAQVVLADDDVGPLFFDVTADNNIAADDALMVINYINRFGAGEGEAGEGSRELGVGSRETAAEDVFELLAMDLAVAAKRKK